MGWRILLADDMGLGKTREAPWMVHDSGSRRLLVVCPVSVKLNSPADIEATLGYAWTTPVIDGTQRQPAAQLVHLHQLDMAVATNDAVRGAVVINYDLLRHLEQDQLAKLRTFALHCFAIGDESHYLKSRDAERTELVTDLFGKAKHVALLTGTP